MPAASAERATSSSKSVTAITSASMPPAGVPTLLPSPSNGRSDSTGETSRALSAPRFQPGKVNGSVQTESKPALIRVVFAQPMAFSICGEPARR